MVTTRLPELDEATLAARATHDRRAFDELHSRLGPPAWRLAVVATADAQTASAALADGIARALRDESRRDALRIRALVATLAAAPSTMAPCETGWPPAPADLPTAERELVVAYGGLPARYRAALWVADAERLPLPQAATIMGQSTAAAGLLVLRARAGLRAATEERLLGLLDDDAVCRRARHDLARPGTPATGRRQEVARRHLQACPTCQGDLDLLAEASLRLRSVIEAPALPASDLAWARWQAGAERPRRPLGLVLPGGWAPPAWAERAVAGAAAAVVSLGIASAVALGARDAVRPVEDQRATSSQPVGTPGGESAAGSGAPLSPVTLDPAPPPPEPIQIEPAEAPPAPPETARVAATGAATGAAAEPTPVPPAPAAPPAPPEPAAPTQAPPAPATAPEPPAAAEGDEGLLQVDVHLLDQVGLSVGDGCTGLDVAGTTLGCTGSGGEGPLALKLGGSLLGG